MKTSRRSFMAALGTLSPGLVLAGTTEWTQERPPAIAPAVVNEFVRVAHGDLDRVKVLLDEHPHLLNAAWDWGNGDFETAMGAAGHMGLKDYANYLAGKGARMDVFVLTMLGKTSIVKAFIEEYPTMIDAIGPHGFTLLHHAKQGGSEGEELFEFFQSRGLKDLHRKIFK